MLAALVLREWLLVAVIAEPDVIRGYYFGSEAMIAHGGWHYRSAETYAAKSLATGAVALLVSGILLFAMWKRNPVALGFGYLLLIVGFALNSIIYRV